MKLKPAAFIPELLRHLFKRPATIEYPFEKLKVPDDFRGTPVLKSELCIVCRACVRDCPAFAIEIETLSEEEKKYKMTIHNDRCIHCAQCVESCPTKALFMNDEFEIATDSRLKLKAEYTYTRPKKSGQQSQTG
ncbi:MAG TPA: NADH-quinone oxidoreductase subunit I [bacterium]|nr:NADH-quinone oxidoreductase subunit I [bacterium]HOL35426.1 NADH-quinone oxidoreductase subunit I [bacterium]HPP08113.1 NADH-quinone oxidoreductase subunit I [bacterium]